MKFAESCLSSRFAVFSTMPHVKDRAIYHFWSLFCQVLAGGLLAVVSFLSTNCDEKVLLSLWNSTCLQVMTHLKDSSNANFFTEFFFLSFQNVKCSGKLYLPLFCFAYCMWGESGKSGNFFHSYSTDKAP